MFRRSVKSILRRFGYDIVKYSPANFARLRRIELLRRVGVTVVLDVGANIGQFGREIREDGYKERIVSFEPLPAAFAVLARLADDRWECFHTAVGDEEGHALLHVSEDTWSSSLLPVADRLVTAAPGAATSSTTTVAIRTLDSFRDEVLRPGDRAHLKIDTQGYEHMVLAGATATLRQVVSLELELSLLKLYEGQQLLPELLETVERLGFGLTSVADGLSDPVSRELLQVDALFARRDSAA